jgi:hypothetical protein
MRQELQVVLRAVREVATEDLPALLGELEQVRYTAIARLSGLTADRVLVNIDTTVHPELINSRFAYVSISRAAQDAELYTNSASSLAPSLSHAVTKSSALSTEQTVAAGLSV